MTPRLALLPLAAIALGAGAPGAHTEGGASISVTVTDLRNANGLLRACMTAAEDDFPECKRTASVHTTSVDAAKGSVVFTFDDVAPGRYAIALLHDENANGKADRALGMIPKEGFGFSRDAKVRMGPPKFDDAAFDLKGDDKAMSIKMRYLI